MACLTSLIEPLRAANEISGTVSFEWRLLSETNGKIRSSAEIDFDPSERLDQANGLDCAILLSPPTAQFENANTAAVLGKLDRHGVTLGAISGGVFPLVRAGLGSSTPISVHWCYRAAFEAEFPTRPKSDAVIEVHPRLVTASGAAAAFELALHLIEDQLDRNTATEVACWFQHPMMRRANIAQSVPTQGKDAALDGKTNTLVQQAVDLFAQDMSAPWTVGDVAHQLGISPRHLERTFKQATGLSPSHYYRKMRMDAARQIVMYTNDHLRDIAMSVGYGSVQAFTKHYKTTFDVTPSEDRKRINLYRTEGNLPVPAI